MAKDQNTLALFTINQTPVKARPGFWLMFLAAWVGLGWIGSLRWPGHTPGAYVIVGVAAALLAMAADIGHACAHTVGARMAGAPMDYVLLGADMPRTIYINNDVPPRTHIIRSLGGPVYSAAGLLVGIAWLSIAPAATVWRYLGEVWTAASGFIFLAIFTPIPIVDGGVILKWLLVIGGRNEAQADRLVLRISIGAGVVLAMVVIYLVSRFAL